VVLMSGDLNGVPNAIGLSKATIRNIGQNLFWAFAYNVVLIPVAAGAALSVHRHPAVANAGGGCDGAAAVRNGGSRASSSRAPDFLRQCASLRRALRT
jgi:cation transport ATPase